MNVLLLLALSPVAPGESPAAAPGPSYALASLREARADPREALAGAPRAEADEVTLTAAIGRQPNHLNAFLATRWLDDSAWEPVDKPLAAGLSYDANTGGWFNWDVGAFYSQDGSSRTVGLSTESIDIETFELSFGLLKIFETRFIRPYLGAGGAWTYVDGRVSDGATLSKGSDSTFGGYLRGGLLWPVHNGYVGLDLRAARFADVRVGERELGYAYGQLGIVFGYGF